MESSVMKPARVLLPAVTPADLRAAAALACPLSVPLDVEGTPAGDRRAHASDPVLSQPLRPAYFGLGDLPVPAELAASPLRRLLPASGRRPPPPVTGPPANRDWSALLAVAVPRFRLRDFFPVVAPMPPNVLTPEEAELVQGGAMVAYGHRRNLHRILYSQHLPGDRRPIDIMVRLYPTARPVNLAERIVQHRCGASVQVAHVLPVIALVEGLLGRPLGPDDVAEGSAPDLLRCLTVAELHGGPMQACPGCRTRGPEQGGCPGVKKRKRERETDQ